MEETITSTAKYEQIHHRKAEDHIRIRPDMYCGSNEVCEHNLILCDLSYEIGNLTRREQNDLNSEEKKVAPLALPTTASVEAETGGHVGADMDVDAESDSDEVLDEMDCGVEEEQGDGSDGPGLRGWTAFGKARVGVAKVSDASLSIFNEILMNALDRRHKDPNFSTVKVTFNTEDGWVEVWNNGTPISTGVDEQLGMSVLEVAFTLERSSSNYDDQEKRLNVGRNGYGAKICTWLSKKMEVVSNDVSAGKKRQLVCTFGPLGTTGLTTRKKANKLVKSSGKESFVSVKFWPDWEWMGIDPKNGDIWSAWMGKVCEMAACLENDVDGKKFKIGVKVNKGKQKEVSIGCAKFCKMLFGEKKKVAGFVVGDVAGRGPRMAVSVQVADVGEGGETIGFVNGTRCDSGDHIAAVTAFVRECVESKIKDVNPKTMVAYIKQRLRVVVVAWVHNPAFDSQRKVALTTKQGQFGFKMQFSDKNKESVLSTGIVDAIKEQMREKKEMEFSKEVKAGAAAVRHLEIDGLDDALDAGIVGAKNTLWITEGKSAKGMVTAGLNVIGRKKHGVFPIRGKLINLQKKSVDHTQNVEVKNLIRIIGFDLKKEKSGGGYTAKDLDSLRYRYLIFCTDQDDDGSHIRGLLLQFLRIMFPSVFRADPEFARTFATQIIGVRHGGTIYEFYTQNEYYKWMEQQGRRISNNCIKYYKGLGTHSREEVMRYFKNLDKHLFIFTWDDRAEEYMDMAFNPSRANDRKRFVSDEYDPDRHLDYSQKRGKVSDFINYDFINYCTAANQRAIPDLLDSFKPVVRKIMWHMLTGQNGEPITHYHSIARVVADIATATEYTHGEKSMETCITGQLQCHVGTNNINLLVPEGNAGSRQNPPSDHGSARYLMTCTEPLARFIFRKEDDATLTKNEFKGKLIEPKQMRPVVPWILVNGDSGMGEGYSTNIPPHNISDIIQTIKALIEKKQDIPDLQPFFFGWKGTLEKKAASATATATAAATASTAATIYVAKGVVKRVSPTKFLIKELPPHKNIESAVEYLLYKTQKGQRVRREDIKQVQNVGGDVDIGILVETSNPLPEDADLYDLFGLKEQISYSNMHALYNKKITKFNSALEIIKTFYDHRIQWYLDRKEITLRDLRRRLQIAQNSFNYITFIMNGKLPLIDQNKQPLTEDASHALMERLKLDKIDHITKEPSYTYLDSMDFRSLKKEKVKSLSSDISTLSEALATCERSTPESMWLADLQELECALPDYYRRRQIYVTDGKEIVPSGTTSGTLSGTKHKARNPGNDIKKSSESKTKKAKK